MNKAMNQSPEFHFSKEELSQVNMVIQRTGSWLSALIDWAERRKCKFNAHHVQSMAQICSEVKRLGNHENFIAEMKRLQDAKKEQVIEVDPAVAALEKAREMIHNAVTKDEVTPSV